MFRGIRIVHKTLTPLEILNMAHINTLFAQTLSLIPRHVFQKLEKRHKTGRCSRKFGFKEQFTFMAFVQLAACASLRHAIRCLETLGSCLYHWGLKPVRRSTVSDANASRPVGFFKDLFHEMYRFCSLNAPKHGFKFKSKLFSLDSTTIGLCLSVFPWAQFRKRKGGVKLHVLLDHDGLIPAFANVTTAKVHDSNASKWLNLPKGSMLVFDRGYVNYQWFCELWKRGIQFVTRMKKDCRLRLLERWQIPCNTGVTSDHLCEIKATGQPIRKIGFFDQGTGNHYYFLTNDFTQSAEIISEIYKQRWKIELFFKEIKQNLKVIRFVGHTKNAVKIQLYTALIIYLLLAWLNFKSRLGSSIQILSQLICLSLTRPMSIEELIKPPVKAESASYNLSLLALAS